MDDLLQVASVGLIKAIDRYDPSRGVAFSSYAVPTIAGELKRYFRDHTWAVRPPRGLQEIAARIDSVTCELTHQLGRAPTTDELSTAASVDEESLLEAVQASRARAALSLQACASGDSDFSPEDWIGHDDGGIDGAETQAVLNALLTSLSSRERQILRLRFDEDMTQTQIGALIGLSQMQVSRIVRQALERLRSAADRPPSSRRCSRDPSVELITATEHSHLAWDAVPVALTSLS